MPSQVFPQRLSRVHTRMFSHLCGRSSCRSPEGLAGGQGHLQGGPVAQFSICCPLSPPPRWVSRWELRHLPGRSPFSRWLCGQEEKGQPEQDVLSPVQAGGEEPLRPSFAGSCGAGLGLRAGRAGDTAGCRSIPSTGAFLLL